MEMDPAQITVTVAGIAAIVWVIWYFSPRDEPVGKTQDGPG